MVTNGFQPPFFPELETEVVVPSVQEHLCRCSRVWQAAWSTLLHSAEPTTGGQTLPATNYQPGQKVWLSPRNFPLQTYFHKLAPRSIWPFEIDKIVNPAVVLLKLPLSLRVHQSFHLPVFSGLLTACSGFLSHAHVAEPSASLCSACSSTSSPVFSPHRFHITQPACPLFVFC